MATRFTDAQVASYIQNNALSGAGLQQAAQVFQLAPDQVARAQVLLARNDPAIAAASQAYEAAVAGRPDLVAENLSFYNAATGTGSGLLNAVAPAPTAAPTAAPTRAPMPVPTVAPTAAPTAAPTNISQFENWLRSTPNLTDAQIVAEMGRLGVTNRNVANITGAGLNTIENRVNALAPTLPFANATQGFTQDFNNYTSIAPGAQFAGGQSPYSQIMAQMRPVGNPYATARAGLPMGGYDPGIYDPNLLSNFVRQRAAELKAAGLPVPLGMDGGDGPGGVGDGASSGSGDAAGDAAAAAADAAAAASGEGTGPGTGAGWYMGGLIDRVSGKNPAGPDDGQINVQVGEYVVKKSSVNKYGKGLLDMINEGKIPAKKIKSLLD